MFTLDSRHFALIGSTAAALAAGIYVFWGPSEPKRKQRKKKDTCPGLVNLGNSCFLNAVLQALAPCNSIVQWLAAFTQTQRDTDKTCLADTLGNVLRVLNNGSVEYEEEYCPSDILDTLRAKRWIISSDEQDAHELFHVLTETIDEETSRFPRVVPLFNAGALEDEAQTKYQPEIVAVSKSRGLLPVLPNRDAEHPFRGLLASQLQCKLCAHKCPVKYDTFDSLSLSIPAHHVGTLTLEYLLKEYISPELVHSVECDGCAKRQKELCDKMDQPSSATKPRTTFLKKLTIGKLPQCLCFHIQRTVWLNNGMPTKRFDHVSFPEVLHMDGFVYHKKKKATANTGPDLDFSLSLIGGRKGLNGYNRVNTKKIQATSPTLTVPYSRPVNLLKALNYHSRATMSGLRLQSLGGVTSQSNTQVQLLAQTYTSEAAHATMNSNSYKLNAVVVHLGDLYSGHFITYRRAPSTNGQRFPDKWLYTSDTQVKKVTLKEVLHAGAYMLFYEKM